MARRTSKEKCRAGPFPSAPCPALVGSSSYSRHRAGASKEVQLPPASSSYVCLSKGGFTQLQARGKSFQRWRSRHDYLASFLMKLKFIIGGLRKRGNTPSMLTPGLPCCFLKSQVGRNGMASTKEAWLRRSLHLQMHSSPTDPCACSCVRTRTHTQTPETQRFAYPPLNILVIQLAFVGLDSVKRTHNGVETKELILLLLNKKVSEQINLGSFNVYLLSTYYELDSIYKQTKHSPIP